MALMLSVLAAPMCLLLGFIYNSCFGIAMEGLTVMLFTFEAVLLTAVLGVPYALLTAFLLKRTPLNDRSRAVTIFVTGAVILMISLAILFPCLPEPYFVGGYLLRPHRHGYH